MEKDTNTLIAEFLKAFGSLETAMGLKEDSYPPSFAKRLNALKGRNFWIRKNIESLVLLRELRNQIAHDLNSVHELITPGPASISLLEAAQAAIASPPLAVSRFRTEIREFSESESLSDVYIHLHDKDFSQVFFRAENSELCLLSANTMQRWSAAQVEEGLIDLATPISEVFAARETDCELAFMPRDVSIFEVQAYFAEEMNRQLIAVLVTENGKSTERPLACITHWDMAMLLAGDV